MTKEELLRMVDDLLPPGSNPTMFLAMWDGRIPRVRPMALVRDGLRFYFGTGRDDAKTDQIAGHPQVEFVALLRKEGNTATSAWPERRSRSLGQPSTKHGPEARATT